MDKTREFIVEPIKEATIKNKKKLIISLVITAVLLLLAALAVILTSINEEPKERYTMVEQDVSFTYETAGSINSSETEIYERASGEGVEIIANFAKEVDDTVAADEALYSYQLTTIGTEETIINSYTIKNATVLDVEGSEVLLRTAISLDDYNYNVHTPEEGQCVIFHDGEIYGNAEISLVEPTYAEFVILNAPLGFNESRPIGLAYIDMKLSNLYSCDEFGYNFTTGEAFTDYGSKATVHDSSTNLNVTLETMEEDITDEIREINGSSYIGETSKVLVKIGDEIMDGDNVFEHIFLPYNLELIEVTSEVKGYVSDITDETITIVNTDLNHLEFNINQNNLDKIAVNQSVIIEIGDLLISDKIDEIILNDTGEYPAIAIINNPNFKEYNRDQEASVTVEADEEDLLLIPKKYIVDSKVMKVTESDTIETQVQYIEYNTENYLITAGLIKGDTVEEF